MLHLHPVSSFEFKKEIIKKFSIDSETWVVSDLRSKLEIQKLFLSQSDLIEEDAILRASEFWMKLSRKLLPDYQVYSKDVVLLLLQQRLKEEELEWAHRPGSASVLFSYMTQLMPILSHPRGQEMLKGWFSRQETSNRKDKSYEDWKEWAELSFVCWNFLIEKKCLARQWVSGALLNLNLPTSLWNRTVYIDCGAELTVVEAELIKNLSEKIEVHVLYPDKVWSQRFTETLSAYQILGIVEACPSQNNSKVDVDFLRFATMSAEVKNAVGMARTWVDAGIEPEKVVIVAPDIELYWPCLSEHLKAEGLPVAKKTMSRLHSLPSVSRWMSEVRLRSGLLNKEDLEMLTYGSAYSQDSIQRTDQEAKPIKYEEFARVFNLILGEEDLNKVPEIQVRLSKKLSLDQSLTLKEFAIWNIQLWRPTDSVEALESMVHRLYQEGPEKVRLSLKDWVFLLEGIVGQQEQVVEKGQKQGLQCLSLHSLEYADVSHVLVMGLADQFLITSGGHSLPQKDIFLLQQQLGFCLSSPENQKKVFECAWCLTKGIEKVIASFPETDFSGSPLGASAFWLTEKLKTETPLEKKALPLKTCWDAELQKERALEDIAVNKSEFARLNIQSLSATSFERYSECPFRFAAEKVFKLSDLPNLDLDVDHQTKGILIHKVFEKLVPTDRKDPTQWQYSDESLGEIIDESFKESELQIFDPNLWPALKEKTIRMAKRFIEFEKKWQSEFPKTETIGKEVRVEGYLDPETGQLTRDKIDDQKFYFKIRGAIDRIDSDGKSYVLLDYKSSKGRLRQHGRWIENDQLQMAIYTLSCEEGLTIHEAKTVLAGLYYIAKTMDRETGFKCLDAGEDLYIINKRSQHKITIEEKEKLLRQTEEVMANYAQKIKEGEFLPSPKDVTTCNTCRWKDLCRAPHLS